MNEQEAYFLLKGLKDAFSKASKEAKEILKELKNKEK